LGRGFQFQFGTSFARQLGSKPLANHGQRLTDVTAIEAQEIDRRYDTQLGKLSSRGSPDTPNLGNGDDRQGSCAPIFIHEVGAPRSVKQLLLSREIGKLCQGFSRANTNGTRNADPLPDCHRHFMGER
jgi:hypothetical protein